MIESRIYLFVFLSLSFFTRSPFFLQKMPINHFTIRPVNLCVQYCSGPCRSSPVFYCHARFVFRVLWYKRRALLQLCEKDQRTNISVHFSNKATESTLDIKFGLFILFCNTLILYIVAIYMLNLKKYIKCFKLANCLIGCLLLNSLI